jgi:hypothetical protein
VALVLGCWVVLAVLLNALPRLNRKITRRLEKRYSDFLASRNLDSIHKHFGKQLYGAAGRIEKFVAFVLAAFAIYIPNSMIRAAHILNYSIEAKARGLILHTSVTDSGGVRDYWHTRRTASLNDFHVTYEIDTSAPPNQMEQITSELRQRIQDVFNAAGVEIMSPLPLRRDGNVTTIPAANRRDGYVPTGFRLSTWFLILRTFAPRRTQPAGKPAERRKLSYQDRSWGLMRPISFLCYFLLRLALSWLAMRSAAWSNSSGDEFFAGSYVDQRISLLRGSTRKTVPLCVWLDWFSLRNPTPSLPGGRVAPAGGG